MAASDRERDPSRNATLYAFSTNLGVETGPDGVTRSIWRPIEPEVMRAEYETYLAMKAQGFDPTGAFAGILKAVWDHHEASKQAGGRRGRGRRRASDDTSPPGGIFGAAMGALRRDLPVIARNVAPITAASLPLAVFVPVPILLTLNGTARIIRGLGTAVSAVAPHWASQRAAGTFLKGLAAATFVGNSWHMRTFIPGMEGFLQGAPQNQFYAAQNFAFGGLNVNGIRGKQPYPTWMKHLGFAAANLGNGFLLFNYSIPAGVAAWVPNLLFGGGVAWMTRRHINADYRGGEPVKKTTDLSTRLAQGASALGLMTFGGYYLGAVAAPALDKAGGPDKSPKSPATLPAFEVAPGSAVMALNLAPPAPPLVQPPAYSPSQPMVVNTRGRLNIRSGPSVTSGWLGEFLPKTILQPLGPPQPDRWPQAQVGPGERHGH